MCEGWTIGLFCTRHGSVRLIIIAFQEFEVHAKDEAENLQAVNKWSLLEILITHHKTLVDFP